VDKESGNLPQPAGARSGSKYFSQYAGDNHNGEFRSASGR